ncbi:MAG: hypothetical protein A2X48_07590 [Lentisphaerae bacterium GWF2_49_21]|nr:MAG: hypothetical protein A2X48_07590 [Lentisphaerae bacterium GWF2_49_21]
MDSKEKTKSDNEHSGASVPSPLILSGILRRFNKRTPWYKLGISKLTEFGIIGWAIFIIIGILFAVFLGAWIF